MKKVKFLARFFLSFGCDPRKIFLSVIRWPRYLLDIFRYLKEYHSSSSKIFRITINDLHPKLLDKGEMAGNLGVYFYQDLYV